MPAKALTILMLLFCLFAQELIVAQMPFILHDGTPVRLRLNRNLSSADSNVGDTVDFEVLDDVKVNDVVVIARGGTALATVTEAKHKGRMAKGGKLNVNIDHVRLVDGEKVALRAIKETQGGGHTGAMTGAIVATSIVFFPAAPFFLFMHGKDITIPKGTEITAYVNGEISLNPIQFRAGTLITGFSGPAEQPAMGVQVSQSSPPISAQSINPVSPAARPEITVTSNPSNARVEIGGTFVGLTPLTLALDQPGQAFTIKVKLDGFQPWFLQTVSVPGRSTVHAELSQQLYR